MVQVVIKYGGSLLLILLLLVNVRMNAQVHNDKLKKPIVITGGGLRVDSFLNLLSRRTGLGFSFNSKKISPAKTVSIPRGNYTMAECLAEIQKATGIHYAVMNNHIILVDNPPKEQYRLNLGVEVVKKKPVPVTKKRPVATKPKPVARRPTLPDTLRVTRNTALAKDKALVKDSAIVKDTTLVRDAALVKHSALVKDTALVKDSALVKDTTLVKNSTLVKDSMLVKDTALVKETALVKDSTLVKDTALVKYSTLVKDSMRIKDSALVKDTTLVKDSMLVKDSIPFIDSLLVLKAPAFKDSLRFTFQRPDTTSFSIKDSKPRRRWRGNRTSTSANGGLQLPSLFGFRDTTYYRNRDKYAFKRWRFPGPSDSTATSSDSAQDSQQDQANSNAKQAKPTTSTNSPTSAKSPTSSKAPKADDPLANWRKRDRSTYKPGRTRSYSSFNESFYDESKPNWQVGIVGVRPDIYDMIGFGINLQYEHPFGSNSNWSWTASAGYHQVLGDYTTTKFKYDSIILPDSARTRILDTTAIDTTLKNFAQIPLLLGIRCYVIKPFYAAIEAGYSLKASDDVSASASLAPSLGVKIPMGRKAIDINFKYLYMLSRPTFEKPRLQKGDYGLWSLRVAIAF